MGRPPLCQRHYWFGSGIATRPADAGQIRAPRQQDKSQQVVPGTWRKKKVRLKLLWAGQNGTHDAPAQDSLRYDFLPSFPFIGHNRSVALSSLVPSQALGVLLYQCDKPHSWAPVLVINFFFFFFYFCLPILLLYPLRLHSFWASESASRSLLFFFHPPFRSFLFYHAHVPPYIIARNSSVPSASFPRADHRPWRAVS